MIKLNKKLSKGICVLMAGLAVTASINAPVQVKASSPILLGDVNSDGTVDSGDYTTLRRHLLGITKSLPNKINADANLDGIVDSADYTILRQYLIQKIDSLPQMSFSSTNPPQAAVEYAKMRLDNYLEEYYPHEYPEGYFIKYETWVPVYNDKYMAELGKAKDVSFVFDVAQLAMEIKGMGKVTNERISAVLLGYIKDANDREPGISDIPDCIGITGWLTNNIREAKQKLDYIERSNYKYLVRTGGLLFDDGPRGKFIEKITELEDEINNGRFSYYSSSSQNQEFRGALLLYLKNIKDMNINYENSLREMNSGLNNIAGLY